MKKKSLKLNKQIIASILDNDQMKTIMAGYGDNGYAFSLIGGCSSSLCVSNRCSIGITAGSGNCC